MRLPRLHYRRSQEERALPKQGVLHPQTAGRIRPDLPHGFQVSQERPGGLSFTVCQESEERKIELYRFSVGLNAARIAFSLVCFRTDGQQKKKQCFQRNCFQDLRVGPVDFKLKSPVRSMYCPIGNTQ